MDCGENSVEVYYDEYVRETDKRKLFLVDGEGLWVPKKVIIEDDERGTLSVPEWWAIDRELV